MDTRATSATPPGRRHLFAQSGKAAVMPLVYLAMGYQMSGPLGSAEPVLYAVVFAVIVQALVLLHELGHVLFGHLLGRTDGHIIIKALGAVTRFTGDTSTISNRDHALIATGGPLVQIELSFVIGLLGFRMGADLTNPVMGASIVSMVIGLANLLPLPGFDGWLIAKCGVRTLTGRGRDTFDIAPAPAGRP